MSSGPHAHVLARRWTLAAGAVLVAAAWIAAGGGAAAGAGAGAALVVLFLSSGAVALRLLGREDVPGGMGLVVYLLSYALRLLVLLFVAALVVRSDLVDAQWLGIGLMVSALAWITAHTWHAWRRARSEPIVEPDGGGDARPSP